MPGCKRRGELPPVHVMKASEGVDVCLVLPILNPGTRCRRMVSFIHTLAAVPLEKDPPPPSVPVE